MTCHCYYNNNIIRPMLYPQQSHNNGNGHDNVIVIVSSQAISLSINQSCLQRPVVASTSHVRSTLNGGHPPSPCPRKRGPDNGIVLLRPKTPVTPVVTFHCDIVVLLIFITNYGMLARLVATETPFSPQNLKPKFL